jgi:hypothetical protein
LPSFQSLKHHFSGWEIKGVLIPATEAQRVEALKSTLEKLTKALKFIRFLSRLKFSRTRENTYPIVPPPSRHSPLPFPLAPVG